MFVIRLKLLIFNVEREPDSRIIVRLKKELKRPDQMTIFFRVYM